jgi:protocatechuate 3,4-dioxygenase alpha subunit
MSERAGPTPSQTVGPFFAPSLLRDDQHVLAGAQTEGERIRIEGHVFDGEGNPVPDAVLEIWQANAGGRYHHPLDAREELPLDPDFTGFGRSGTDDNGRFWFETVKPGSVPYDDEATQAPHILVTLFARGLLHHLSTRLYFSDEPANESDPILQLVPAARRGTLIAAREENGGLPVYRFDILLRGDGETAFLAR